MDENPHQKALEDYYHVNRSHLQWSFWSSLGALAIGLAVLVIGVIAIFRGSNSVAAQIATVSGVLTQFIGAGFFYLYSKNLKQLNVFSQQIVKLQDTLYAIGLVAHLPEPRRAPTFETIIATLITRNEPKTQMSPELVKAYSDAMKSRNAT
ncbi:TRADD-N-associated membrane domain-containing protein [Rhodanobacter geophilus]|uniref:Cyanobacterial TRADD-N associated 2 transmembrane domain-containing protein n=1 Tax=Rhodanobacter geophilus TaxID=3162488 RepID=A0ABV3QPH7_9GAMM